MSEGGGLINLGDLAKPVTVFVEKVCDAIGETYRPHGIVRTAKAQARADIIAAEGRIKIADIERRGLERLVHEEGKKQANIEKICDTAIHHISNDAKTENLEGDWLVNFFDKCKLISDSEMQMLWAKILAGEANQPGRFSKRTVGVVSGLDKSDATVFTQLCRFSWRLGSLVPLIYNSNDENFLWSYANIY